MMQVNQMMAAPLVDLHACWVQVAASCIEHGRAVDKLRARYAELLNVHGMAAAASAAAEAAARAAAASAQALASKQAQQAHASRCGSLACLFAASSGLGLHQHQ
jgi:hypothetical protein